MNTRKLIQLLWLTVAIILTHSIALSQQTTEEIITSLPLAEADTGSFIYTVQWNNEGDMLLAATSSGVYLFDQNLVIVSQINPGYRTFGAAWSPNSNLIAVTYYDQILIWQRDISTNTFSLYQTLTGGAEQVAIFWSSQGSRLATIEGDFDYTSFVRPGQIRFWSTSTWQSEGYAEGIYNIENFSPDYPNQDQLDPLQNRLSWHPRNDNLIMGAGLPIQPVPSGGYIGDNAGNMVFVINVDTKLREREFDFSDESSVNWHPSGALFTTGSSIGSFQSYNSITGDLVARIGVGSPSQVVQWSPNGRYLLSGAEVFDVENARRLGIYIPQGNSAIITSTWHPTGNALTIAYLDGTVKHFQGAAISSFLESPVAIAGPDQVMQDLNQDNTELVSLDASSSYDPDGIIQTAIWLENGLVVGTENTLSIALPIGVHLIELRVTDNDNLTDSDFLSVTILPPSATPTIVPTPTLTSTPFISSIVISDEGQPISALISLNEQTRAWFDYTLSLSAPLTGTECVTLRLEYYPPTPSNYAHVQTKPSTMSTWSTAQTLVFDANHTTYNVRIRARDDSTNHTGAVGRLGHRIIENEASGCTSAAGFVVNTVDASGMRLTGSPFNGGNDASASADSRNVLVFIVEDND